MGFGGGGSSQTTTSNELPPELRPIVTGAGNQILNLQGALPLTAFAGYAPQAMPGISGMQQEALRYAGNMAGSTPTALTGLMGMAQPMGQVSQAMMDMSGRDVLSPYMSPLAGISESLFNSASSPGSLAGRQAAFDVLSNSGRVAPVNLGTGATGSDGRVDFSSARGGSGGGSGGSPSVPQLSLPSPQSAGSGFQFNTNALAPPQAPAPTAGPAGPSAIPTTGPVPDIIGQVINTPTIGPVVPGQPIPHTVPLDTTQPTNIFGPLESPFRPDSGFGLGGSQATPPAVTFVAPPTTPVGISVAEPGSTMPDPNNLLVNQAYRNGWLGNDTAYYNDPYFTPVEMAQNMSGDWYNQNTPVQVTTPNGVMTVGYMNARATSFDPMLRMLGYYGNNPYGY